MSRTVHPRIKKYTFSTTGFVDLQEILGFKVVYSLELRSEQDQISIKDTESGDEDVYQTCEIFQLHENFKGSICGYNVSYLQVGGSQDQEIIVEFAT